MRWFSFRRVPVSLAIVALALLAMPSRADIIIQGYSDATNDRFSNNAAFIANTFNLSGVGQTNDANPILAGRWATAISRNVIVSAEHLAPGSPLPIHFYPGNDPSVAPVVRTVESSVQVPGTDLWLARLNAFLPSNIAHYSFATEPLVGPPPPNQNAFGTLVTAGSLQGRNAYMFGRSPFNEDANPNDNRFAFNDQAIGRNLISGYVENANSQLNQPDLDVLVMFFDTAPPNQVPFEALLQGGDSGGPLFVEINGQFILLGVNSVASTGNPAFSGISYIGNQAAFVNNFIANAIPEPASGLLAVAGLAGLATLRGRKAA
jgi:hypothetical protein